MTDPSLSSASFGTDRDEQRSPGNPAQGMTADDTLGRALRKIGELKLERRVLVEKFEALAVEFQQVSMMCGDPTFFECGEKLLALVEAEK